jgi:hypothetical protein
MKLSVCTIRVPQQPLYNDVTARWLQSYSRFKPEVPHDLIVVDSDVAAPKGDHGVHTEDFRVYTGGGWDCGIWQWLAKDSDADLLVCLNTSSYPTARGWLEKFKDAFLKHGAGLYGSMSSFYLSPHIRTPVYVFPPEIMRDYPVLCDSREKTYTFECAGMKDTFTSHCLKKGLPVKLVTWDGVYDLADSRKPDNIFRRGDQSNILVKDRHCDNYEASDEAGKRELERQANGL